MVVDRGLVPSWLFVVGCGLWVRYNMSVFGFWASEPGTRPRSVDVKLSCVPVRCDVATEKCNSNT